MTGSRTGPAARAHTLHDRAGQQHYCAAAATASEPLPAQCKRPAALMMSGRPRCVQLLCSALLRRCWRPGLRQHSSTALRGLTRLTKSGLSLSRPRAPHPRSRSWSGHSWSMIKSDNPGRCRRSQRWQDPHWPVTRDPLSTLLRLVSPDELTALDSACNGYRLLRAQRLDWNIGDTGHGHRHVTAARPFVLTVSHTAPAPASVHGLMPFSAFPHGAVQGTAGHHPVYSLHYDHHDQSRLTAGTECPHCSSVRAIDVRSFQ